MHQLVQFITELWPLYHGRILFLLLITEMNGWNLTNSVINAIILTCYKTSLDFVNISESVISVRLFLSYNGPGWGHLCYTDTFLVFYLYMHQYGMIYHLLLSNMLSIQSMMSVFRICLHQDDITLAVSDMLSVF